MIKGSLICSTSLYEKIKETSNESDTREVSIICEYFFPFFLYNLHFYFIFIDQSGFNDQSGRSEYFSESVAREPVRTCDKKLIIICTCAATLDVPALTL